KMFISQNTVTARGRITLLDVVVSCYCTVANSISCVEKAMQPEEPSCRCRCTLGMVKQKSKSPWLKVNAIMISGKRYGKHKINLKPSVRCEKQIAGVGQCYKVRVQPGNKNLKSRVVPDVFPRYSVLSWLRSGAVCKQNMGMIGFDDVSCRVGSVPRKQSHLVNALCNQLSADSKRTDFALAA